MYASRVIRNGVIVALEASYILENTNDPTHLFSNYDIMMRVVREVIIPNLEDPRYCADRDSGVSAYQCHHHDRNLSSFQELLTRTPLTIPLSRLLIALATQVQTKMTNTENDAVKKEAIKQFFIDQMSIRCTDLAADLEFVLKEIDENGEIRIDTI